MNETTTEISDPAAKPNDKSDLDVVRLMETYGLSNTSPQTSPKQQVQIDDITVGIDIGFENTVNSTHKEFTLAVPILHGAPIECDICTEWHMVEELETISQVTLVATVFKWEPIYQQIGMWMPYSKQQKEQYISLR